MVAPSIRKEDSMGRTIICLIALFVSGILLGQRFKSTPKNMDLKAPPSPPVCNLDHAESDTFSYSLDTADNFQILDITFDEGIVGNIVVNVNHDPSIRDTVITRTLSILYEKHQCAGVDLVITVPKRYPFERLNLKSNYKGNIEVQSIKVETLNVKAAHGDIYIRDTSAAVSALKAPDGAIDAQITIGTRLRTFSGEDTRLEFYGAIPYWMELESESEKNLTVIYKGDGAFSMSSTTRPRLSKYLENVVNITSEDKHTLEGYIGVTHTPGALPRLTMTGHDTNLYLLVPRRQARIDRSSEIETHGVGKDKFSRIAV